MATESNHGFRSGFLLIISMMIFSSSSSSAYKFNVGGKDGWVVKPSEDYSHWAQRNRFQVNDTLYFKYKKGSNSIVMVKEEDYHSCNPKHPIHKMEDGNSMFILDKSGPFYFISGNIKNCKHGQKLIVVVLALTHHKHTQSSSPPAAPPSPAEAKPPAASGSSLNPSVAPSISHSPAPSPSHSGSKRFGGSVGAALAVSVGLLLFFSSFA